jgi:hypothetical protein
MTFDEVMTKFSGAWQDDRALINGPDGYTWCIATKVNGATVLTRDGERFVAPTTEFVPETPKKQFGGRKKAEAVD